MFSSVPEQRRASIAVRGVAAAILALSALLALLWLAPWRERHQAVVTFEYSADVLRGTKQGDGQLFQPFVREYFETQRLIIASRTLCERAVDALAGAEHGFAFKGRSMRERSISDACNRLLVRRLGEALIVELKYEDVDPDRALLFADSVADAYVERTQAVSQRQSAGPAAFQGELEQRDALLADSEKALRAFAEAHDLSSLEARRSIAEDELRSYAGALTKLRIHKVELVAKLNALLQSRAEIGAGFTDGDTRAKALRARITELELMARGIDEDAGGDAGAARLTAYQEITRARAQLADVWSDSANELRAELRVVEAEELELTRLVEEANNRGVELMGLGVEYARLERAARLQGTMRAGAITQLEKAQALSTNPWGGGVRILSRAHPVEDEWLWGRWGVPGLLGIVALAVALSIRPARTPSA